jgi:predicted SprT family Zn-dependent metalloprotease
VVQLTFNERGERTGVAFFDTAGQPLSQDDLEANQLSWKVANTQLGRSPIGRK